MEKWFKDYYGLGCLALVIAISVGSGYLMRFEPKVSRNQSQLQSADLNGNGKPEKFYTIEGKVAVTEADGEPIVNFLNKHK